MKILYVDYFNLDKQIIGGSTVISNRNYNLFKKKSEVKIVCLKNITSKYKMLLNILKGYTSGVDLKLINEVKREIDENKYDFIYLGNSLTGHLAKEIKKYKKDQKIITFFHNVEQDYINSFLKNASFKYKIFKKITIQNECYSVKNSDIIITLNERDSERLGILYDKKADYYLPTSFDDMYRQEEQDKYNLDIDMLFVGSNFFGNIEGLDWFIKNCLEKIKGNLYVVGKGMEELRDKYKNKNLIIVGSVKNLDEYYYRSKMVVLPILSGSGMKTKTCEALMYGKLIIGSKEAFEGYDLDYKKVGEVCYTEDQYIKKINELLENNNFPKQNQYSREIFLKKYETKILEKTIELVLKK